MPTLSKSKLLAAIQCARRVWWDIDEADKRPGPTQMAYSARWSSIVDAYLSGFPEAFVPTGDRDARVVQTRDAISRAEPVIHRARLVAKGVHIALDRMVLREAGWQITDVRATASVKASHTAHAAVTVFVFDALGLPIEGLNVAHINTRSSVDAGKDRFRIVTLTDKAMVRAEAIKDQVDRAHQALSDGLPEPSLGPHCRGPVPCRYLNRCHRPEPAHGIGELYRVKAKVLKQITHLGVEQIADIPPSITLPAIAARQCAAVSNNQIIVDPKLGAALADITRPTVYIDFEAIQPPLPPWPRCRPFGAIPVQVSLHRLEADGRLVHTAWLASPGVDPRPGLATFLAMSLKDAGSLVAYHASFESRMMAGLALWASDDEATVLRSASKRFVDLLPMVRSHVYHPDFRGRFGLKVVVEALLPALSYNDLGVKRGDEASILLEAMLIHGWPSEPEAIEKSREALLAYCERDTLVMVRLEALLRELAEQHAEA